MFDEDFVYELKIPKERVAVVIGKGGDVKKTIESSTKTDIEIESSTGDVFIYGSDALGMFTAREVVKAIGRGFNPEYVLPGSGRI